MIEFCVHCGWPVAPEGVTLTGEDAEPRECSKAHRCDDTACIVDRVPCECGDGSCVLCDDTGMRPVDG